MAGKRKHSSCSLREKLEVLHRIDNGESASKLAEEFSVGRATISDWKKNRHKLERFCYTTSVECLERRHTSKISPFDKVDEALYIWFMEEREKGTYLTGPLIQEKALQLNQLFQGEKAFAASNGWLDRWKKRHGIRLFSMPGERERGQAMGSLLHGSADRYKHDTEFVTGYLPAGNDPVVNGANYEDLSQQESCTPDFKLSRDYFNALNNEAHNLTFPERTPKRTKNLLHGNITQDDTALLRERFKRQLAAAVKRYSVPALISDTNCEENLPDEILHLVKEVPSDCDREEGDVSDWVTTDIPDDFESGDEEVAKNKVNELTVSTVAATKALDVALRYVRQHPDATPTDVTFMERWRNLAASSLLNDLRIKKFD